MNPYHRFRVFFWLVCILIPALSCAQLPPFQWVGQGGGGPTFPSKVLHDDHYAAYIAGQFKDSTDLDPGPGVQMAYSNGFGSYFQKYDPNGTFLFSLYYPRTTVNNEVFTDIVLDHQGNIYASGYHDQGSIDLDPGPGVVMSPNSNRLQNFILKLDPNGNYLAAYFFTPPNANVYLDMDMEFDPLGNLYLLVNIGGLVDVDPGPGLHFLNTSSIGTPDVGLIKLDPNMNFLWAFRVGGPEQDQRQVLAIDPQGNPVITGVFKSNFDLDPGPNSAPYSAVGLYDIAYAKYSPTGALLHSGMFVSYDLSSHEEVWDCEIDNCGDIYISGNFDVTEDFDPSPGVFLLSCPNFYSGYLVRLRPDGSFVWAKQWDGNATLKSIGFDAMHHIYGALAFGLGMDADPGTGVTNVAIPSSVDILVLELDTNANLISMMQLGAQGTDHYPEIEVGPTGIITLGGIFQDSVDFDPGPATAYRFAYSYPSGHFIARYGTCLPYDGNIQLTSCGPVNLYGVTLPGPGYYDVVAPQSLLCDSVYHVAITPGLSSSGSTSLTGCNDITVNAQTFTNSGTYTQHLTNAAGCDSILTLTLTLDSIDIQVSIQGQSLVAAQQGAFYQWLDCDSAFQFITGETQQSFTPQFAGNYAVIVSNGTCQDTSQCQHFILQGVMSNALDEVQAWPNPGSGLVNVLLPQDVSGALHLSVINSLGQVVLQSDAAPGSQLQLNLPAVAGIYLLRVVSETGNTTLPLVRQ